MWSTLPLHIAMKRWSSHKSFHSCYWRGVYCFCNCQTSLSLYISQFSLGHLLLNLAPSQYRSVCDVTCVMWHALRSPWLYGQYYYWRWELGNPETKMQKSQWNPPCPRKRCQSKSNARVMLVICIDNESIVQSVCSKGKNCKLRILKKYSGTFAKQCTKKEGTK